MTGPCHANTAGGAQADDRERTRSISGAAFWLQLAAAPTFAVMALLTAIAGNGASDILCATALDASPLTGMVPMYVLMSAFHAGPWLSLASRGKCQR